MVLIDVGVTLAQARRGRNVSVAGCIELHKTASVMSQHARSKADNGFPRRYHMIELVDQI